MQLNRMHLLSLLAAFGVGAHAAADFHLRSVATTTIHRSCVVDCDASWSTCSAAASVSAWAENCPDCLDAPEADICNNSGDTYCSAASTACCRIVRGGYYFGTTGAWVSISHCGNSVVIEAGKEDYHEVWHGHVVHGAYTSVGVCLPCQTGNRSGDDYWEVEHDVGIERVADPNGLSPMERLRRTLSLLESPGQADPQAAGLIYADPGVAGRGVEYDPIEDYWHGVLSMEGSSAEPLEITTREFDYVEDQMDVNQDGRFNELDPPALAGLEGSTEPEHLQKWDFNQNGVIDAGDVAVMQTLVDLEWDSGLLGDHDGDGDLDCADLEGIDALFPGDLTSPGYRPELDDNLDGILEEDDRHWVYHAVLPGDIDADGDVDLTDQAALLSSYGKCEGEPGFNPYADIDRDGCVTLNDLSILLANYGRSCN